MSFLSSNQQQQSTKSSEENTSINCNFFSIFFCLMGFNLQLFEAEQGSQNRTYGNNKITSSQVPY